MHISVPTLLSQTQYSSKIGALIHTNATAQRFDLRAVSPTQCTKLLMLADLHTNAEGGTNRLFLLQASKRQAPVLMVKEIPSKTLHSHILPSLCLQAELSLAVMKPVCLCHMHTLSLSLSLPMPDALGRQNQLPVA